MNGIDVNDSDSKYQLRTLLGSFTGFQLLCHEYAPFKQFARDVDQYYFVFRQEIDWPEPPAARSN